MPKVTNLKNRTLSLFAIWAIGVGLVISGESFGWNNGWAFVGPKGFLIPMSIVTVMYFFLVFILRELATVYPNAEGPHSYAKLAYGNIFGDFVAIATLIEFLFATPAIANAIGQYLNFLLPNVFDYKVTAILLLVAFSLLNLTHISFTAKLMIGLAIAAIVELVLFGVSVSGYINPVNFTYSTFDNYELSNIIKAMPFAIWLFLGLEGVSLLTRNIQSENFAKKVSKGYFLSFATLTILAFVILFIAGSSFNWTEGTWHDMTKGIDDKGNDHPLPFVMKLVLPRDSWFVNVFTFVGLTGLVASLQSISLASINQLNYLSQPLISNTKNRKIIISSISILVGVLSIIFKQTGFLIEVSVFGAVCLYMTSAFSLLKLRTVSKKDVFLDKDLQTIDDIQYKSHFDYNALFSKISSILVILVSIFCVASLIYQNVKYFAAFAVLTTLYIILNNKNK